MRCSAENKCLLTAGSMHESKGDLSTNWMITPRSNWLVTGDIIKLYVENLYMYIYTRIYICIYICIYIFGITEVRGLAKD